ncbi:site-specific integrase [Demequina capsici]|uniref:Site-specific integrase n=1 Tax=Demequina capsici TaxID=3075620 RepID=A0AA96FD67_9MICO|nr:site-specific integrase [Demequina sp. PMTSA13]WNM27362.1 site-specific integrase [Demequina sp. PMTSA13]
MREQSLVNYRSAVKRIIATAGDAPLHDLTPSKLGALMREAYEGVPTSHRLAQTVVVAAMRRALADGVIDRDPTAGLRAAPPKRRPAPRALTPDQLRILILCLMERATDMDGNTIRFPSTESDAAVLQQSIGARVGEVLALRWSDITFDEDAVIVSISGTVVSAVRGGARRQDMAKTSRGNRTVRTKNSTVRNMLERRRTQAGPEKIRVFSGEKGGWLSPHTVHATWRKRLADTELAGWTPHALRSTYVTNRALQGVPMEKVAAAVGHGEVATTRKYYAAVDPNRIVDAD